MGMFLSLYHQTVETQDFASPVLPIHNCIHNNAIPYTHILACETQNLASLLGWIGVLLVGFLLVRRKILRLYLGGRRGVVVLGK